MAKRKYIEESNIGIRKSNSPVFLSSGGSGNGQPKVEDKERFSSSGNFLQTLQATFNGSDFNGSNDSGKTPTTTASII